MQNVDGCDAILTHRCVGGHQPERHNANRHALLEIMTQFQLAASTTFISKPATFVGGTGWHARIEYILVPVDFLTCQLCWLAQVHVRKAFRLHRVDSLDAVDYRPLCITLSRRQLQHGQDSRRRVAWDHDKLMRGVLRAEDKTLLLQAADGNVKRDADTPNNACSRGMPSLCFDILVHTIRDAAVHLYWSRQVVAAKLQHLKANREFALHLHRRLCLIHKYDTSRVPLELLLVPQHLNAASRQVEFCARPFQAYNIACISEELDVALRLGRMSEAWRIYRAMANARKGAMRKWSRTPLTSRPMAAPWMHALQELGKCGGWSARQVETNMFFK